MAAGGPPRDASTGADNRPRTSRMPTAFYIVLAAALALLALRAWRARHIPEQDAGPHPAPPAIRAAPVPGPDAPWVDHLPVLPRLEGEALRSRLRDRYIAARFPGIVSDATDLANIDLVIRAARLCFEEDRSDQAQELLQMAIDQSPDDEPLRLAQLEISFLQRNRTRFVELAREFRERMPQSRNWGEIARLGRAVAPEVPEFAAGPGTRPHEHYGPWPDLPNWIQASWDLTAEVLAADFRRAVLRSSPSAALPSEVRLPSGA
jgi:hypothetical protein